ncbi:MAG: tetratricopeptide repeat protein [Ktedonobacterales bacterium]|nr:tetratricopeptide repeat protein [Ktedonobacterales bacterium]
MAIIPFQRLTLTEADSALLRQQLAGAQTELATITLGNEATRLRLLGKLGEWHYLLGECEMALPFLTDTVAMAERGGDARALAANRLRLATALQYANRHREAVHIFTLGLRALAPSVDVTYRDFFLQHYGKCLVEMGDMTQARACLAEALTLRIAKGDAKLIASTEQALAGLAERDPITTSRIDSALFTSS